MEPTEIGRQLVFNLKRAESVYKNYLAEDQKFLHAKNLKKANDKIIEILTNYNQNLPKALENDMLLLLEHLEIWSERWVELQQKLNPSLDDVFIFQNTHQFPKSAAQKIINYVENNH